MINFFILTFLFGASKRRNLSEAPQRNVKTRIISFFISINYFTMLWTEQVNKVFSPRIFISKKMVRNLKLPFTNVPFRHNSACGMIKKWLRIITVRLVYIS